MFMSLNTFIWKKNALTPYGLVMQYGDIIWVNIGSGNGLMPDGTKLLTEPQIIPHIKG